MTIGHFVWTDLSTYDMQTARRDYTTFFGWKFQGDPLYDFVELNGLEVAGLFPMPTGYADMDMPSFWMSYVHVDNVEETVKRARQHEGCVIEVEPQAFNKDARVALVRDPSGAGFTLYEGPEIISASEGHGTIQNRYHHVHDIGQIEGFYSDLFEWSFVRTTEQAWPTYDVVHPDGTIIACVEEASETIRGKFKYWMPCFNVESLDTLNKSVTKSGGKVLSNLPVNRTMFADQQGAHFLARTEVSAVNRQSKTNFSSSPPASKKIAWKTILGLVFVWLAVMFDVQVFWGILFIIWTWPALKTGQINFIEPISRSIQPITYWAIIVTWIILSLWLIALSVDGRLSG